MRRGFCGWMRRLSNLAEDLGRLWSPTLAAMRLPRGWGTRDLWVATKEQATAKATAGPSTSLRMTVLGGEV